MSNFSFIYIYSISIFSEETSGTLDVNMVSLDESLSVNMIQTHLNDDIEIRCDIIGKPLQPKIKWYRNNVDLASLNIPNIKVSLLLFFLLLKNFIFFNQKKGKNKSDDNVDVFLMNFV